MTRRGVQNKVFFIKSASCKRVHMIVIFNISNFPVFPHWIIIQQFGHTHDTPEG